MKRFHAVAAVSGLLLAFQAWGQFAAPGALAQGGGCPTDIGKGVHGMVLFGTDRLYASHIPVFHAPDTPKERMRHCWQAHFEVEISHPAKDAKAIYLEKAVEAGKQRLITLKPKPFVLPKVLEGKDASFEANIYEGNFEEKPEADPGLLSGVTVKVVKSEHHGLDRQAAPSPSLGYAYLGPSKDDGGEAVAYLAHVISAPDNFDHIVQIRWNGEKPALFAGNVFGETIHFRDRADPPGLTADAVENRLKPGQTFEVAISRLGFIATPAGSKGIGEPSFTVIGDFYCLAGPDFVPGSPCP